MKDWISVCTVQDVLVNGGSCIKLGEEKIAIFNLNDGQEWYAVQNRCPHQSEYVLSRGLVGCQNGEPKVACPLHKNAFSLKTGMHLGGNEAYRLKTYPIRIEAGNIYLKV